MKRLFFSSLILTIFLFSCEKQIKEINQIDQLIEEIKSSQVGNTKTRCAELVYPVDYKMPDGTIITVEKEGGLREIAAEWYRNNQDIKEKPTLVFPIEMIFKGNQFTINNENQLKRVLQACGGEKAGKDEAMKKRIYGYLVETGIPRDKLEATMGGLNRAMAEAKGKGKEYRMSQRLRNYFSVRLGLADEQIAKIRGLAIRLVLSKEKGSDNTGKTGR